MTQDSTRHTTGAELLAVHPSWAKAAIVAELHENDSDAQTDYFNHKKTREVLLAWSRHIRDLFPELRKAADRFAPTAHLGVGKGNVRVSVVLANDYVSSHGGAYWMGQLSPWHREELDGEEYKAFETRDAAEAWIAQAPLLEDMHDTSNGDSVVKFTYRIGDESIEHREKWSMGHGYYLKKGHTHDSGWAVRKHGLWWCESRAKASVEVVTSAFDEPADERPGREGIVTTGLNADKCGVELRFADKPSNDVRARLKAHGWRWSRYSGCWYNRDTPDARQFAASLSDELGATPVR